MDITNPTILKVKGVLFLLLLALLGGFARAADPAESAVDAIAAASSDPRVRTRLGDADSIRVRSAFLERWRVWMVEFFHDDRRILFVTVGRDGDIREIGPAESDPAGKPGEADRDDSGWRKRVAGLREELEWARRTNNEAEIREISALLRDLGAAEDAREGRPVNPQVLLQSFRAVPGYGMTILRWTIGGAGRMRLERRMDGRSWESLATVPTGDGVWIDERLVTGRVYDYRAAIDPGALTPGTSGAGVVAISPERRVVPRSIDDSGLPVYHLDLPETGVAAMLADVTEDITVDGTLRFDGRTYPVRARLRGASTRHARKKSYRIRFLDRSPVDWPVTYLKALPGDHTMQQEKLSCDVFEAANAPAARVQYRNLVLNGRYEGVYAEVEPIRAPFKRQPPLDPSGTLIRAGTFQHLDPRWRPGDLRGDIGSVDSLAAFITGINRTDRGHFDEFVRTRMDWPRVRDYLALQVICHRSEIEADDYLFYRTPDTEQWWLLPRDHNNGNFHVVPSRNRIGEPYIGPYCQTIQDLGWRPDHWFVLPSRIFHQPALRAEYLDHLESRIRELVLSGAVDALIDHNFERLRNEYTVDPYRTPFSGRDPFLNSARDLKTFMRRHARRLLTRIDDERRRPPEPVVISEFSFDDDDSGWVELHHRGAAPVRLRGYSLGSRRGSVRWVRPLPGQQILAPGEFLVVRFGDSSAPGWTQLTGDDDEPERDGYPVDLHRDRGRAEPANESPLHRAGGFLVLSRATRGGEDGEDGEETEVEAEAAGDGMDYDHVHRERVVDFFFYGEQTVGDAYGRMAGDFTRLRPTPGRPNAVR